MICRSVGDMIENEELTYDSNFKKRPKQNLTKILKKKLTEMS